MPPQKQPNQPLTREQKELIDLDKSNLLLVCGIIFLRVYEALTTGNLTMLKLVLSDFASLDPQELADMRLQDISQPFRGLQSYNIVRFPDQEWEQSMLDESTNKVSTDCPCMVSFYRGQINVRWTIPKIEYIWQCKSPEKLAYTALVIMEELLHIRQMVTPNTRTLTSLGTMLEFDAVPDTALMDEQDRELLSQLLENDVSFLFTTYLGQYSKIFEQYQWYQDRTTASDMHKPMSPQEFISAIMYLTNKYGYPEDITETIKEDIDILSETNPDLALAMQQTNGLDDFINKES